MPVKKDKIAVEDILNDAEAKKQLLDLLLDSSEDDCEIKLNGKKYKVSLDVNIGQTY